MGEPLPIGRWKLSDHWLNLGQAGLIPWVVCLDCKGCCDRPGPMTGTKPSNRAVLAPLATSPQPTTRFFPQIALRSSALRYLRHVKRTSR